VVPSSRLVRGVSDETKFGTILNSQASEDCVAVEGVSKVLCGLLFRVLRPCCPFPSWGTGIVTGGVQLLLARLSRVPAVLSAVSCSIFPSPSPSKFLV
jgi:hypothetical protein